MVSFQALIERFKKQGEKTVWTYIRIPKKTAQKLNPGVKKSYRVKGSLDSHIISGMSLLPMGEGYYILALNAENRKAIRKTPGESVLVKLELDEHEYQLQAELIELLKSEPKALTHFNTLPKSHQHYFSKWIESAKTTNTRHDRIAATMNAMVKKQGFAEMMRERKTEKNY